MEEKKITIGTVCFLCDIRNDKVLLLERSFEPMKGMYTGVGGKTNFEEDVHQSCIREVKEETGFDVKNLKLKGVIKTVLEGYNSSWILFIYTSSDFTGTQIDCPEGNLKWVNVKDIQKVNLIGFIKEIMPYVMNENSMIEGTIKHNSKGDVLEKNIICKVMSNLN